MQMRICGKKTDGNSKNETNFMIRKLIGLLCIALSLGACGKIELPEAEEGGAQGAGRPDVDMPGGGGGELPPDVLSVADFFAEAEEGVVYNVSGYIVGFVDGTSLNHAVFGLPSEKPNANMLLADRADELDVANCLPVRLDAEDGVREDLNLYDHPEFFRQRIVLLGQTGTYFRVKGLREVYEYVWPSAPDGGGGAADDAPALSDSLQYVEEGRAGRKVFEFSR